MIADSLVFGFDREQGIATLTTVKAFHPPADAIAIDYELVSSRSSELIASRAAVGLERNAGDSLSSPGKYDDTTNLGAPPAPVRTAADLSRIDGNNFEREHASSRPTDAGDLTPVPRRLARAQIGGATFSMLARTIQDTWTFEPVAIDGERQPVCAQVTFLPHGP